MITNSKRYKPRCHDATTYFKTPQHGDHHFFSHVCAWPLKSGAVNLGQGFPDFECDPLVGGKMSRQAMHEKG